jgi:glycosidase
VREYLWKSENSIVRSYLRDGVDGWRLDTAYDMGHDFLAELTESAHKEKSDSIGYSSQLSISPFPVEKQKQFMQEWVEMVYKIDCPVMQEDRWTPWRENNFVSEYVKPEVVNQFKEKFFDWLFSEQLSKKNFFL